MSVGSMKEFDLNTGNWSNYCERVECYFTANKITPEVQLPTLVALIGEETYELIANLVSPKKPADFTYAEIKCIVGRHLKPKPSVMAETYVFRQRRQQDGETVAKYVAELKRLSRECEFGVQLDENMRDQLVYMYFI